LGVTGVATLGNGAILGIPASGTVTNLTGTASININGTVGATTATTGAFTSLTTSSTVTHNGGTANGVAFLNASKVLTTNSTLTFDGTAFINDAAAGNNQTSLVVIRNSTSGTAAGSAMYWGNNASLFNSIITKFSSAHTSKPSYFEINNTDNAPLTFMSNNAEVARVTSTGLAVTGTLSATTGAAVGGATAGAGGLAFPATAVAVADANTLDDYEEGTWTPSIGGNATYTTQVGFYTKIGRQVTIIFNLQILLLGTGSTSTITGAPFAPASSIGDYHTGSVYWETIASSQISVGTFIQQSTADIYFYTRSTAGTSAVNISAIIGSGTILRGTLTYFV